MSLVARPQPQEDLGSPELMGVAQIIVTAPVGVLDYAVPQKLQGMLRAGSPVRVPLGSRTIDGYVVSCCVDAPATSTELKAIIDLDDDRPTLPQGLLELVLFASRYFLTAPGDMLSCALPACARPASMRYTLSDQGRLHAGGGNSLRDQLLTLAADHPKGFGLMTLKQKLGWSRAKASGPLRKAVAAQELVPLGQRQSRGRLEYVFLRRADGDQGVLTARHKRAQHLLGHLDATTGKSVKELCQIDPQPQTPLKTLLKLGLIIRSQRRQALSPLETPTSGAAKMAPELTASQSRAIAALADGDRRPTLLFGVTGSGKTEIYLQAMAKALERGQTALMLVPEIALTPQLAAQFMARFGSKVATFHSGLSVAERRDEWERIASGEAKIGLGARSAVFLPLENLGLVIVDEEHESSFKQDESPRYNARDLAVWRAQTAGAQVVLGSATPSLETWQNAERGRYRRIDLPERIMDRPLPEVQIINLKEETREDGQLISQPLLEALKQILARGEQAILFLNRRGFSPYVFCRDCGHSYRCLDCDVALTLHQRRDILLCHYCGTFIPTPEECSGCGSLRVGSQGSGTERLEAEVRQRLAQEHVVRLDRDTVSKRRDLARLLDIFRRGEAKILIGTQMVAKGHDFPSVTLVGVISADNSLNFPDFRAAERTFALLTQVAGRAGRGTLPGRVLVQAYETEHPAVLAAARHDFLSFVTEELKHREELLYPPFAHLALVRFEGEQEAEVMAAAKKSTLAWQEALGSPQDSLLLLGPAPAPLARLRRHFRVHVLLKAQDRQQLRWALARLAPHSCRKTRRIIDIDPVSML